MLAQFGMANVTREASLAQLAALVLRSQFFAHSFVRRVPQQSGRRLASIFHLRQQLRLEPLRLWKVPLGLDRLLLRLQSCGALLEPLHLLLADPDLYLAGIDQLPALALAEIDAVEPAAFVGKPGDD